MAIRFARRMEWVKASEIRELLKVTQRPSVISLGGGLPAPESFPVAQLQEVAHALLAAHGPQSLQYSTTEGDPGLRAHIAARMNARLGTAVAADDVLVVTGSQQGLDLTGRTLLDEGDALLCESPTYLGAIQAFACYGPRFVEVPTDDDGMLPDALDRRLAAHPNAKFVYVIPDVQNPSGRTWSLERRHAFMEVVARYDVGVLEDSPYSEFRFDGGPLPSLKSLDRHGQVTFLGTFSKVFGPGLRVGWVAAPPAMRDRYTLLKQGADLHTSTFNQMLIAAFIDRFDLDAHIGRVRELYRRRRDAMLAALDAEMPDGVRYTRPLGGLFVWVELPEGLNTRELLVRCLERDVAFVPGGSFFPNGGHDNTMRLNFSNASEERIRTAVGRIAEIVRAAIAELEPAEAAVASA